MSEQPDELIRAAALHEAVAWTAVPDGNLYTTSKVLAIAEEFAEFIRSGRTP